MAKGPWDRCKTTGLSKRKLQSVDESLLLPDGSLDISRWPDCDLFVVSSITNAAGFTHPTRGRDQLSQDPRFHCHEIRDADGHLVTIATHTNSATWIGEVIRSENETWRLSNLKQKQNPPAGSCSGVLETYTIEPAKPQEPSLFLLSQSDGTNI